MFLAGAYENRHYRNTGLQPYYQVVSVGYRFGKPNLYLNRYFMIEPVFLEGKPAVYVK